VAAQGENELFAQWRKALPAERREVEAKLYAAVKGHARAVLWNTLGEAPDDLVEATVVAAMTGLARFRQESKFSTWVEGIARNQAAEHLRSKVSARRVFEDFAAIPEDKDRDDEEDSPKTHVGKAIPSVLPQIVGEIAVEEFRDSLSDEDAALLRYKQQGMTSKEIAIAMGTTVEAVDSRSARIKPKAKKVWSLRRK
jgi:RNA polymerase sigma factor (sigma-70 family)